MEDYRQFTGCLNKFGKLEILSWIPQDHWEYWVLKWKLNASKSEEDKKFWFTKLCNFIHKPFFEALNKIDNKKRKDVSLSTIKPQDWEWTIETNKTIL